MGPIHDRGALVYTIAWYSTGRYMNQWPSLLMQICLTSRFWWITSSIGSVQYIPRNMHMVFALLCFVVVIHWLIFPYPSGLLHWHCGNLTIAPVPAKQPWWIWINTSCELIMNDCITTTKQSTTKPCAYFLGYTVYPLHEKYITDPFISSRRHCDIIYHPAPTTDNLRTPSLGLVFPESCSCSNELLITLDLFHSRFTQLTNNCLQECFRLSNWFTLWRLASWRTTYLLHGYPLLRVWFSKSVVLQVCYSGENFKAVFCCFYSCFMYTS